MNFLHNFDQIFKFQNVDKISYFWPNFGILNKFRNINQILEFQPNFGNSTKFQNLKKHRKNCECCHHHFLLFKGHNVIVHIVVLNCQKCNQCTMGQAQCKMGNRKMSTLPLILRWTVKLSIEFFLSFDNIDNRVKNLVKIDLSD